jgi:hypothetical protein
MNQNTGEIKALEELTEEEKKSGIWKELPKEYNSVSKSKQRQMEYNLRVQEKLKEKYPEETK